MDEGRALAAPLDDWLAVPDVRVAARRPSGEARIGGDTAPPSPGEAAAVPAASADGSAADAIAALIATRDRERDRARRQEDDLRALERLNRALRRDVLSLRVRCWRDEETIAELERELAAARQARDNAVRRGRRLAREAADRRSPRWWRPLFADGTKQLIATAARQPVLPGDGPFFRRGFRLAEGTAIVGATVQRAKSAPSGVMVFGPYVALPPGLYAVEIEARLSRLLPAFARFTLDAVCDGARHIIEKRTFGLRTAAGWRRFAMVFSIWEGEDHPDCEVRVWAPSATPLAIRRLELYRLDETPAAMTQPAVGAPRS